MLHVHDTSPTTLWVFPLYLDLSLYSEPTRAIMVWNTSVIQSFVQASDVTHFFNHDVCNQSTIQAKHLCAFWGHSKLGSACTSELAERCSHDLDSRRQHGLPAVWKPWPWIVPVQVPDLGSHTLRVASPSPPPVTMVLPSGVKHPQRTAPVWPHNICTSIYPKGELAQTMQQHWP